MVFRRDSGPSPRKVYLAEFVGYLWGRVAIADETTETTFPFWATRTSRGEINDSWFVRTQLRLRWWYRYKVSEVGGELLKCEPPELRPSSSICQPMPISKSNQEKTDAREIP